jgi:hypothetical protein
MVPVTGASLWLALDVSAKCDRQRGIAVVVSNEGTEQDEVSAPVNRAVP